MSDHKPSGLYEGNSSGNLRCESLMLQVDQRHEAILVPIYGVLTPFHILTLKNATVNQACSPLLACGCCLPLMSGDCIQLLH
jgi:nucleosome binding factor SPN SPT16 subunit